MNKTDCLLLRTKPLLLSLYTKPCRVSSKERGEMMPFNCKIVWGEKAKKNTGLDIITSLAKEVMFLVALVCLFFCLSVGNLTQKVMNGLG